MKPCGKRIKFLKAGLLAGGNSEIGMPANGKPPILSFLSMANPRLSPFDP
jgi:hypothetical protein